MFSSCKGWSQEDAISCSDVAGEQEKPGSWNALGDIGSMLYIIQNSEDFEDLEQLEAEMGHMQRSLCMVLEW